MKMYTVEVVMGYSVVMDIEANSEKEAEEIGYKKALKDSRICIDNASVIGVLEVTELAEED